MFLNPVVKTLLAIAILVGTILLVKWCEAAYYSNQLSAAALVWLCVGIGVTQHAWYQVVSKAELSRKEIWGKRNATFIGLVMGVTSLLLFTISLTTGGPQISTHIWSWNSGFWFPVLATGLLNIGIQFANTRAKALEDLSLVSPISTSTPAVVILIGIFVLGEMPGVLGWAGIWLLALGTYTLGIKDLLEKLAKPSTNPTTLNAIVGEKRSGWKFWLSVWFAPITSLSRSRGVRWAYLAVLLALFALNYDALTARNANVAFGAGCIFGITALGNLILAVGRREFTGLNVGSAIGTIVLLGILFAAMHVAINTAYRATLMSHIGALKRLAIPLTMVGAYLTLGERKNFAGRLAGGVLMTSGAVLISFDI